MKNKLMKSSVITALLSLFAFVPMVMAQTPSYDQYHIDSYDPALYTGVGTGVDAISKTFNSLAELFFFFTKSIYLMVDYSITLFSDQELIQELAGKVQNYSEQVFDVLYDSFGLIFFVIFVLSIFFTFLFRNTQSAIRQACTLFLVIGLTTAWISHSEEYLKWLDEITDEVAVAVANIGAEGSTVENLHQVAFEQIIYNPFLIMNYGTTEEDVINQSVPNRNTSLLFSYEGASYAEEAEEVDQYVNENESENYYMSSENANQQLGIAMVSVMNAILIGIPIMLCALAGFFIEILILLLALLLPYVAILSLLPKFSNAFFGLIKKIVMLFGGKILVGVIMGGMLGVMRIAETIVPVTNGGTYLLQTTIVFTTFIVVIVFRKQIISVVTDGHVTSTPVDKALKKAEKRGVDVGKKAAKTALVAEGVDPQTADKTVDAVANELEDEPEIERNQQSDDLNVFDTEDDTNNEEDLEEATLEDDEFAEGDDFERTLQSDEDMDDASEPDELTEAENATDETVSDAVLDEVEEPTEAEDAIDETVSDAVLDEVEEPTELEDVTDESVSDAVLDEVEEPTELENVTDETVSDAVLDEVEEPTELEDVADETVSDAVLDEVEEPKESEDVTDETVSDAVLDEVEEPTELEGVADETVSDTVLGEVSDSTKNSEVIGEIEPIQGVVGSVEEGVFEEQIQVNDKPEEPNFNGDDAVADIPGLEEVVLDE